MPASAQAPRRAQADFGKQKHQRATEGGKDFFTGEEEEE